MRTKILNSALDDMSIAAELIKDGGLVAVPTETVYGLAANGLDESAVEKLYEVKGRPETKPISLLISSMKQAESFCREIPENAYKLAESFWPGPLTMVLKKSDIVPRIVTAGGETVGVRCPAHSATLEIINLSRLPLAAPSANISGEKSPKNAGEVLNYFDGKIECVVDGGECTVGIESTILDMTAFPPKVLRLGGLSPEDIREKTGIEVAL